MKLLGALSFAALASIVTAGPIQVRADLQPPSTDPFYATPANVNSLKPGAILRIRNTPADVVLSFGKPLNYSAAYQIAYRTTNNAGIAEVAVTTLLVPKNGDSNKLLSYQFAEDAADVDCAPSYNVQQGSGSEGGLNIKLELSFVEGLLDQGYYVVMPDYEGPDATFLANKGAGQRVLDSIRAALLSSSTTGVSKSARIGLLGYSGGSLASGFAAELQRSYAPELNIVGVALGGTVPNIIDVLYAVNKTPFAGLIPAGIHGLTNAYPALRTYVNSVIVPGKKNETYQKASTQCLIGAATGFAFKDVYSYVTSPDVFQAPIALKVINANMQGQAGPVAPIYIYKGALDTISPINDTQILVDKYCKFGTSVDYNVYPKDGHISLLGKGEPAAVEWLAGQFAGNVQKGCVTHTIS